jgi:hypothetical protein
VTEADRADAALAVIFSNPCACPERHAGTPGGTCGMQATCTLQYADAFRPVCYPCIAALLAVDSGVPPGRASGSASRRLRTG